MTKTRISFVPKSNLSKTKTKNSLKADKQSLNENGTENTTLLTTLKEESKDINKESKKGGAAKKKTESLDLSSIREEIESKLKTGKANISPLSDVGKVKSKLTSKNSAKYKNKDADKDTNIDDISLKKEKKKVPAGFVETGIPGLDELFERGIPQGSAVLLAGGAGSGKTISCLQILAYHASKGEKCFYMSFEESEDRLKQHMKSFGWDIDKFTKSGSLKISRTSPFEITRNVDALLAKEKGELLIDIDPVILPNNFKPDFVVLDSLTAIASAFAGKEDSYRIYIEQLFRFFEKIGATTFLITETKQIPEIFSTTGVEEFLADGVIVFYNFNKGDVRENGVEILKMRGEKHQKKIVAMKISDKGITVYPDQEVFGFK